MSQRAQPLDLFLELRDVLEASVSGCETHVCDLVQTPQLLHDHVADAAARHVALADRLQPMPDALDTGLDVLGLDRTLLQRREHAGPQFLLVERLAAALPLRHVRHHARGGLERREPLLAFQALAPAPPLPPLPGAPRFDDLRLGVLTERAAPRN